MNPRLTDPRLLDHNDYARQSNLSFDYWERRSHGTDLLLILLGIAIGAAMVALAWYAVTLPGA